MLAVSCSAFKWGLCGCAVLGRFDRPVLYAGPIHRANSRVEYLVRVYYLVEYLVE